MIVDLAGSDSAPPSWVFQPLRTSAPTTPAISLCTLSATQVQHKVKSRGDSRGFSRGFGPSTCIPLTGGAVSEASDEDGEAVDHEHYVQSVTPILLISGNHAAAISKHVPSFSTCLGRQVTAREPGTWVALSVDTLCSVNSCKAPRSRFPYHDTHGCSWLEPRCSGPVFLSKNTKTNDPDCNRFKATAAGRIGGHCIHPRAGSRLSGPA